MPTIVWILLSVVSLVVLAAVIVLLRTVDDWSRDLTTNFAATSDDARDPRLRPIRSSESVAEMKSIFTSVLARFEHWNVLDADESPEHITARLERTTRLGFRDDVTVRICQTADGCELTAESRSRIGRGDLGQNPRNLVELLEAIRMQLK